MSNAVKKQKLQTEHFEQLPKDIQDIVRSLILEAASKREGPDCFKLDDECIEAIECHSRDGFIPHSFNRGGIEYRNFTDLMGYWGGGYNVAHAVARAEIEKQIECNFKMIAETCSERFEAILAANKLTQEDCTYHQMYELESTIPELKEVRQWIEEAEKEYMGCSENSIMHSIRVMYHGEENGIHTASVSAAVNTEGPYHRSHISWAPNVFCEGAKEVEISWRTPKSLETKLRKALATVCKAVF
jgi:hypothetical protein